MEAGPPAVTQAPPQMQRTAVPRGSQAALRVPRPIHHAGLRENSETDVPLLRSNSVCGTVLYNDLNSLKWNFLFPFHGSQAKALMQKKGMKSFWRG